MKKLYETPELLKFSLLISDITNLGGYDELSKIESGGIIDDEEFGSDEEL